jgi:hypothetical protein
MLLQTVRLLLQESGYQPRKDRSDKEAWYDPAQPRRRVILIGRDGASVKQRRKLKRHFRRGLMVYSR